MPRYLEVIDMVAGSEAEFSCFVADRLTADPVRRFGTPYRAYEKLAAQLLIGSIRPREVVSVLADHYKTPHNVFFERDVRAEVNARLGRLAITPIVRLDSRAATPLQIVDLLTSAVTFEFRENAGLAAARPQGPRRSIPATPLWRRQPPRRLPSQPSPQRRPVRPNVGARRRQLSLRKRGDGVGDPRRPHSRVWEPME